LIRSPRSHTPPLPSVVFEDRRLEKSSATLPRRAAVVLPRPGRTPQLPAAPPPRRRRTAPKPGLTPARPTSRAGLLDRGIHLRDRGRSPLLISSAATPTPLSSPVRWEPP
jgi:hypothetical protein